MRVFRDIYNAQGQFVRTDVVFDIMEATYTGQDMGKRSIVATIKYATPIDFQMGDYVEFAMQSLIRDPGHNSGEVQSPAERFYIYTEPQCKKTARPMSVGDAFEITVTFYPRQYELAGIQMRDFVQQEANAETLIYTGFDNVSFYGGAKELLDRCMACLKQYYKDSQGNPLWSYVLADALNEDKNNALERYAFSFSGNSVMDALMKLNDKDYINTTFFINGRTIYVGFKRPFLCAVNAAGSITDRPLDMMYGKTSHLPIDKTYGGLYDITKSVGEELPITKLFAYGAARNLNRYYCADRIQSGRFVNKLMLPSFSDDGTTDWIISEDAVKKYGIREGSKTFEEVYPSLRYMTYADIRGIKYCIKVRYSGLSGDVFEKDGVMTHKNSNSAYPVARVQCYQVVPCTGIEDQQTGEKDGTVGCNKLVECQPPEDLAVFIHATGKTVKVLLYGGATKAEACQKQLAHDGKIPTTDGNAPAADWSNCYAGACFAVHDIGFVDMNGQTYDATERANWFTAPFLRTLEYDPMYIPGTAQERAELHRIEYVDTFWLTDLYVMEYENGAARYDAQRSFKRDGYSAWAWPRLNDQSNFPGSLPVNEVVAVEPVTIPDTSDNINGGRQQHWDIYLRDLGFAIDEQNDFGELVFVFSTPVVSVLDGILAGREFTIDGGENLNDFQERVMCAYDENGNFNQDFMMPGDSMDTSIAQRAYLNGAIWRIRLNRNDNDSELSSIGLVIPNTDIHMKGGDHVVLLDIYMPDIYVRAAEQRLLREARNYLDKNDRGNIKYSINFDKVRFNQIQNYSRQMREGVMLRMVDEDLNISSDNKVRTIVQHTVPLETQVPFYTINSQTGPRQIDTLFEYGRPGSGLGMFKDTISSYNESQERLALKVPRASKTSEFVKIYVHGHNKTYGTYPQHQNAYAYDDNIWIVEFDCDYPLYSSLTRSNQTDVNITETIYERNEEKVYPSEGTPLPAISRDYVSFKSGKFYEVVMQVQDAYWSEENDDIILSVSPIDIETRYAIDEYECEASDPVDGWRTVTYKFRLPDSFNDMQGYYIGLYYLSPDNSGSDKIDYGAVRICSVTEKDIDAQGQSIKYVDFKASQVTIKIQDNTRPADSRIKDCYPEPIYEIQATIEEQTKASSWGSLMNNVEKTRIESEETKRTYEMLANIARQNYQQLLNLKNNIFDPDGTCNDVFIQTMMLQVGADSMNYQLDRTFTTPTGVRSNFDVSGRDVQGGTYDKFMVYDDDVLHHFVYTQGAQGGTWGVRGSFEAVLSPTTGENNETIWPTYFVCIKCRKDTDNDPTEVTWICSTKQYAVNDDSDTNYWYFNWGILTADSNGFYSLMETRGNAYMYGDNLICGRISDIAKHSYFDLTHGNFVLSNGDESDAALSYINGVLTIKGFAKDSDITNILVQLGVIDGKINDLENPHTNLWPIDEEVNLTLKNRETHLLGYILADHFNRGDKFVMSYEIKNYSTDEPEPYNAGIYFDFRVKYIDGNGDEQTYWYDYDGQTLIKEDGKHTYNIIVSGIIEDIENTEDVTVQAITEIMVYVEPHLDFASEASFTIYQGMIVSGNKSGVYSLAYKHLTDALQGSTQIAGGLMMTNLLMLKNEQGEVISGMSGLTKDGENVAMWSGGTYEQALAHATAFAQHTMHELAKILPVLITKNGYGSHIGCFTIEDENTVYVENAAQTERIKIDTTDGIIISTRASRTGTYVDKVRISGNKIDKLSILGESLYGQFNVGERIVTGAGTSANYTKVMSQLNLSGGVGNWDAAFQADRLYITFTNGMITSWKFDSMKVYIGNKLIVNQGSYNYTVPTSEMGGATSIAVPLSTFSTIPSGVHDFKIVFTGFVVYNTTVATGEYINLGNVRITKKTGSSGQPSDYADSSINFSNTPSKDIIEIGSNGIQVSHKNGGFVQMLNDSTDLYVRMFGLPNASGTSRRGELYMIPTTGEIKAHT